MIMEKAKRLTVDELKKIDGRSLEEILADSMMDAVVPALCEELCEVEPDGKCWHGHPSILLAVGLI